MKIGTLKLTQPMVKLILDGLGCFNVLNMGIASKKNDNVVQAKSVRI